MSIRLLDPKVAQRIAAGEVIERPQSIVRELLDNAIDAKATAIDVYLEDGGISSIRVIDNGYGMSYEDLKICCKSHATSKVRVVEDLYKIRTLGFRGEALYSIAACTDLTITSAYNHSTPYTIEVSDGIQKGPHPGLHTPGTTITASNIFYTIPGRKKFLKRPQSEATACKDIFIEKALAFPHIAFRLFLNSKLNLNLPVSVHKNRIMLAYQNHIEASLFSETQDHAGRFSLYAITGSPSIFRNDRKFIQVFVNNRKIQDYSLIQAISYGYSAYLPGGCLPYCFLFISIDPDIIDFNIHPAKREVKIRIQAEVHHQIVKMLQKHLLNVEPNFRGYTKPISMDSNDIKKDIQKEFPNYELPASYKSDRESNFPHNSYSKLENVKFTPQNPDWFNQVSEIFSKDYYVAENSNSSIKDDSNESQLPDNITSYHYIGQIFNLFLLIEKNSSLFIIDQHAAHERIIYDKLKNHPIVQKLLIPQSFEVSPDTDEFLITHYKNYEKLGIMLQQKEPLVWTILALPEVCKYLEKEIIDFIQNVTGNEEEIEKKLYAMISCKAAIKDGEPLDQLTAISLLDKLFTMNSTRCPHGRPIWKEIRREELFKAVGRII